MKRLFFLLAIIVLAVAAQAQTTFKKGIVVNNDTIPNAELAKIPYLLDSRDAVVSYTKTQVDSLQTAFLDNEYQLLKSLGARFQNMPIGASIRSGLSVALSDNTIFLQLLYPQPYSYVIDSLTMIQYTQGNYTGDNENRVGVYSYNLATDTYTLRASIANNSELWKASTGATITCVLTTPYTTTANEILYTAVLYNNSAQSTGPTLVGTNLVATGYTDKAFLGNMKYFINAQKTGQNTLPSSFTSASRIGVCPMIIVK